MDDARARLRADLQTKRALLRSVLRAENYEEAARLRDEIQSLETGLNMAESGAD
jgi:protein-arginine kinase activator protein McsA